MFISLLKQEVLTTKVKMRLLYENRFRFSIHIYGQVILTFEVNRQYAIHQTTRAASSFVSSEVVSMTTCVVV